MLKSAIHMKKAIIFLAIIFFGNFAGMYFGFYLTWWFDTLLHSLGGFFVAMLFADYLKNHLLPDKKIKNSLIIVGATAFIGVIWEFAEYTAAQTLIEPLYNNFGFRAYFIGDLDDTIKDLLMDIVGAFFWLVIFKRK